MKHRVSELQGALLDAAHPRFKHGATIGKKRRSYIIWERMRSRCRNPADKRFANYGGRGIKVCAAWDDYATFIADMGEPPPGLTLERKDVDGPYSPENCRWATQIEQHNNTTQTLWVEHEGDRRSLPDWCRHFGLPYRTIWMRYKAGKRGGALFQPLNSVKSAAARSA